MSTNNQYIVNALHKLLNSGIIKDIYPMVTDIEISDFNLEDGILNLIIFVDTPNMTYNTMYDYDFDPFYLVDYHVERLLPYIGIKIPYVSFDVYRTDGKYVAGYESNMGKNRHPRMFKHDEEGNKIED